MQTVYDAASWEPIIHSDADAKQPYSDETSSWAKINIGRASLATSATGYVGCASKEASKRLQLICCEWKRENKGAEPSHACSRYCTCGCWALQQHDSRTETPLYRKVRGSKTSLWGATERFKQIRSSSQTWEGWVWSRSQIRLHSQVIWFVHAMLYNKSISYEHRGVRIHLDGDDNHDHPVRAAREVDGAQARIC